MAANSKKGWTIAARISAVAATAAACVWGSLLACGTSSSSANASPDAQTDAGVALPTPIRYVVVLVKENHTFDNIFGAYPGANGTLTAQLSDGGTLDRPQIPPGPLVTNPTHLHDDAVTSYADGGMNGFDLAPQPIGDPDPLMRFRYYPQTAVPNYYALAGQYALCDGFFSTVLADSFPGYLSLIAAQSPAYGNPAGVVWRCGAPTTVPTYDPTTCATSTAEPCFSIPSIVDDLPEGITWRSYTDQYGTGPLASPFDAISGVAAKGTSANTRLNSALMKDLAAGDLANITYVWGGKYSEHPPEDICNGENDTVAIANALMQSPHWNETLLIVTWDDWGGFYDHVAPAAQPCSAGGGPFNLGFRVPTLLISPWAKKGLVYHTPTEQASIPRLIEDLFGLPRLSSAPGSTARDGIAGDLRGAFDFAQAPEPGLILTPRSCP